MDQDKLNSRIENLKEGDFLDFTKTNISQAGLIIQVITEKAIKVNNNWIPKSQIVSVEHGFKYKGIESNEKFTECKQIILSQWFDNKLADLNWEKRGASGAY